MVKQKIFSLRKTESGEHIPPISILISSFNEEKNISETLRRIFTTLPNCEVVLVEGGNDHTLDISKDLFHKNPSWDLKLVKNEHDQGKGHGIRVGISHAKHAIMAQVDADSQFPPEELPQLLKPILEGSADIVFASRFAYGATIEQGSLTRMRRLANYIVSKFTSLLSGTRLTDVNAGFKAWKSDIIKNLDIRCNHFGYEPEIAILAAKKKYTIVEVPVNYKGRQRGISNVKLIRDGIIIPLFLLKTKLFR